MLPWWAVALAAAVVIVLLIDAFVRNSVIGFVAMGLRVAVVLLIGWVAILWTDRMADRDRIDERLSIQARAAEMSSQAAAPGSPLACLDALAGESVETPCEKALFAAPETVAAATTYIAARLALLADILEYGERTNTGPEDIVPGLQASLGNDRFGVVAQVLASRDGCTAENCESFALFRDAGRIRANLQQHTFNGYVSRNSAAWSEQSQPASASAPAPVASIPIVPPTTGAISPLPPGFSLPSAASIPPVNIMTPEPTASTPPSAVAPQQAPPPARRPTTARKQTRSSSPTPSAPPPVQITPPAATGAPAR